MATESEKTQINWTSNETGSIYCQVPFDTQQLVFKTDTVHESWKVFLFEYGIKQYVSSAIANLSMTLSDEQKTELAGLSKEERKVQYKELKKDYLRKECHNIRTAIFNELKQLTSEKTKAERAGKETKAQVEVRVKAEMREETFKKLLASGIPEVQARGIADSIG